MPGHASSPPEPQGARVLLDSRTVTSFSALPPLAHVTLVSGQSRAGSSQREAPPQTPGSAPPHCGPQEEEVRCEEKVPEKLRFSPSFTLQEER